MINSHRMKRSHVRRSGAILVCVLACIVIVTGVLVSMVRISLTSRRELRHQEQLYQTQLLLDAGINRCRMQVSAQPDYQGETWDTSGAIARFPSSKVQIMVSPSSENSYLKIEIVATLGSGASGDTNANQTQRRYIGTIEKPNLDTGS